MGSIIGIIAWFAVIALAFFIIFVRPQRRRVAAHQALVDNIKVGDQVITTGGLIGEVETIEEAILRLRIADGVTVNLARGAIAQLIPDMDALAEAASSADSAKAEPTAADETGPETNQ